MANKLFSCLNPRLVRNKYTGDYFQTGCGVCKACLERLANKASYLCSLQELDYKYCMFVTLTYSNENVPLLKLQDYDASPLEENYSPADFNSPRVFDCYDATTRPLYKHFGEKVGECAVKPFEYAELLRKFKYFDNSVPYLSRYDAQCFMKRFRKHLKTYSDEKISYYLVGEYGPVHFRPHFHVLFYFNDAATLENFGEVLHKAWTFGYIDYSLSRGKANSYVAKYVNCRNSVPKIYSCRSLRPFCLHSQNFALGFYKSQKAQIYANVHGSFNALVRCVNGSNSPTYSWRSLVSCFFPKCRRYNDLALSEITYSYLLLQKCAKVYGKGQKVSDYVEEICKGLYMLSNVDDCSDFDKYLSLGKGEENYLLAFIDKFLVNIREKWIVIRPKEPFDYRKLPYEYWRDFVKPSIASMLYISKHFQSFVCDDDLSREHVSSMIGCIREYYRLAEYYRLCSQYELQETMSLHGVDTSDYLYTLYDNVFPKYTFNGVTYYKVYDELYTYKLLNELPLYGEFLNKVNENWHRSVKHKVLNDMNDIFCLTNNY